MRPLVDSELQQHEAVLRLRHGFELKRRDFFKLVAQENAEKARFSGNFPDRPQGRPETRLRRG